MTLILSFSLVIAVRPLEVNILFNNQPLSADRQYEVQCEAIGSRPPSIITWWMNNIALVALPSKVSFMRHIMRLCPHIISFTLNL